MGSIALTGLVLLASLQMGAQKAQTADDKSHEVVTLENAWNQAVAMHDESALKGLLSATFVFTDYDGRFMDRDQWLKRVRIETKDNRGLATMTQATYVYGDTIVVTGTLVDKMRIKGEKVDRHSRFTDTWISQNGHWECVASQITLTAP
jgi:Domain of unknown function (DUF4440)